MGGSYPTAMRKAAQDFRVPTTLIPANDNNPAGPRPYKLPIPANDNFQLPRVELPSSGQARRASRLLPGLLPVFGAFMTGYELYRLYESWGSQAPWYFTDAGWTRLCGPVSFPTEGPDPCLTWPSMPWFAPLGAPDSCGATGQSFSASGEPDLTQHNLLRAQKREVVCAGGDFAITDVWFRSADTDGLVGIPGWYPQEVPLYPPGAVALEPQRYQLPGLPQFQPEPYYKPGDKDRYDPNYPEGSERGYSAPVGPVDMERELPNVTSSSGRPIGRQPPRPREKEKKVKGGRLTKFMMHSLLVAAKVHGKMVDLRDFTEAFWKNIPKHLRSKDPKCKKKIQCMLADIWLHWDEIDGGKAFLDMIKEISEDVIGGAGEALRDEAAKQHGWFKYKIFTSPRF